MILFAEDRAKGKPIFILGRSLGGAVSIYLGSHEDYKNKISGFILENTFTSIQDMVKVLFPPLVYVDFLRRNHWRSIDRIGNINRPILFIKSLRDELIPPKQMDELI